MLLPHWNAQKNASTMYKRPSGEAAALWSSCAKESGIDQGNNLLWRTTEQRMACFRAYTWYRTENPVLIPSSTFNQLSGSKFGWPSSFHHMRQSVTFARWNLLLFLGLKTCVLVVGFGHLKPSVLVVRKLFILVVINESSAKGDL